METEITKRLEAGWINWKKWAPTMRQKDSSESEGEVHNKTVTRPAVMNRIETCAAQKRLEKQIEVNEMRMLQRMCGVTRKDKMANEHIRGTTRLAPSSKKITRDD